MKAVEIDRIGDFVITEIVLARGVFRYGIRELMSDGRWCPIGPLRQTLSRAYLDLADLVAGAGPLVEVRKAAHLDHIWRFNKVA